MEREEKLYDALLDRLGAQKFLDELVAALSTSEQLESFEWIARCYDIDVDEDEDEDED